MEKWPLLRRERDREREREREREISFIAYYYFRLVFNWSVF